MSECDSVLQKARFIAEHVPGWSKTKLAREAGLGINGLVDLFEPNFNPRLETVRKIEAAVERIENGLAGIDTFENNPSPVCKTGEGALSG